MPPPDYPAVNQFLLAEDDALKKHLEGIVVPGDKPGRKVPVYFRFPEQEKQIIYPFITLDLIGIDPAYDLWTSNYPYTENSMVFEDETTGAFAHTGLHEPSVSPSVWTAPVPPDPSKPLRRWNYLPYRLFYQITTWSKTFAHDRVLTARLMRDIIAPRPNWLRVEADGTWKRLESLGWSAADIPTQEGNIKRIFRKAFTVSVQTELPQDNIEHLTQQAHIRSVALRGFYMESPDTYWTEDATTDYWEVIAGEPREDDAVMSPGVYPLHIYRGDSFAIRLRLWKDSSRTEPSDLTGATAKAQIRETTNSAIAIDISTTVVQPNFVDLALTPAVTATLQGGVWDLEITQAGTVRTVLTGDVLVQADVTHG